MRSEKPAIESVQIHDQTVLLVRESGIGFLKAAVIFLGVLLLVLFGLHLELRTELDRAQAMQAAYGYSTARALAKVGVHYDPATGESRPITPKEED